MTALSISRRFEYLAVGVVIAAPFFWSSYKLAMTHGNGEGFAALIIGLLGVFVFRGMFLGAFGSRQDPLPDIYDELKFKIRRWWHQNCRKFEVTTIDGVSYYSSLCDMRTWALFDRDGYLIGWHGEDDYDGYPFFKLASAVHGDVRYKSVSWFSLWRSGKLPDGHQGEVIDSDDTVVGHTTYKVS